MTEETINTASRIAEMFGDLAKAQAEFAVPVKNSMVQYDRTKFRYADLQEILKAVRPALNKYGIFLIQKVESGTDSVTVETFLCHKSGETISSGKLTMPIVAMRNKIQAFGSAETYARRYSLCAFVGVSADDDDDGQSASSINQEVPAAAPAPAPAVTPIDDVEASDILEMAKGMTKAELREWMNALAPSKRRAINAYTSPSFPAPKDFVKHCANSTIGE